MLEMVVVKMMMISDDLFIYLRLALTDSALVTLNALKIVRLKSLVDDNLLVGNCNYGVCLMLS